MGDKKIIIAIDGYASTGKSTFAKLVAKGLGYIYADSGALYRAVAYFAYTNGFVDGRGALISEGGLRKVLPNIKLMFKTSEVDGASETYLNGVNIEKRIRTGRISAIASPISKLPFVREYVDRLLREMGRNRGLVMDGRDIGTVVFPDAELKIFMTATERVRAQRRYDELKSRGGKASLDSVLESLIKRDYNDSHREIDPLVKAKDAIELDNTSMTLDEEIEWINSILKRNFNLEVNLHK